MLVFVHGFGCSHEDWQAQRKALDDRHEVIACDLPGHGRTPGEVKDAGIVNFSRPGGGASGAAIGDHRPQHGLPCGVAGGDA